MTPRTIAPLPDASRATSFPLSRAARAKHSFDAPSFAAIDLARVLAAKLNAGRDLEKEPENAVKAGRLAAAALLNDIFAHVIALYVEEVEAEALEAAPAFLDSNLGEVEVAALLEATQEHFAPPGGEQERPEAIEYLLRLHLANLNPALDTFSELFNDTPLQDTSYAAAMDGLRLYFETLPPFGPDNQSLFDLLLSPIRNHPDSVEEQLRFILAKWERLVIPFLSRILTHLDVIREEEKPTFFGPGPAQVLDFRSGGGSVGMEEYEAFTPDKDWMPSVVLIAKQTYVWLDQLTKKYGHHIYRLDQVPDEELDEMASRGINGLWLIGLCQRSRASQKIKHITGNPDALASAYSLYSYDIAWEIGGAEALENLKSRAGARGIRMASDMVPNHMAIDSQWIMEHPDWFLSLPEQPFPNASFDGPDLSDNPAVGIFLEDGYYSKTEASVVFRRLDRETGENRFVYHGNDGTAIPWNDTAQLDYLKPEVREAVIQTILSVARQFPIIRFDAAMTLAKRHIHRLWFPAPGSGGDIPSRAGRGLTAEEFDALMPHEFWREVVARVGEEVPDTLLLAEAFWMMEGFFVRTLGMHRVYNSAFMNMLRDEKNDEYRLTLKNTLEFDPDILGRFVNFMNNPDEKTAAEQFGKGDKYFGVCTLLATLPGLPMIGHGQIEGYMEKYGMEYPRAYWNEVPDAGFMAHHKVAIFPLLHKRYLFAGSQNFTLYDFWNGQGNVDEDVFAYSNRAGNERALVVFNNRNSPASGWIKTSATFAQKNSDGSRTMVQRELANALNLTGTRNSWTIFRENTSNLEYLRSSSELAENGLFIELGSYGHQVFLDWREVSDESGLYLRLANLLEGSGVPNVERALKEMLLEPIHGPFRALCDETLWAELLGVELVSPTESTQATDEAPATLPAAPEDEDENEVENENEVDLIEELESRFIAFLHAAKRFNGSETDENELILKMREDVQITLESGLETDEKARLLAYSLVSGLGALGSAGSVDDTATRQRSAAYLDEWLLGDLLLETLAAFDAGEEATSTLKIWLRLVPKEELTPFSYLTRILADDDARAILGINTFERVIYFNGEGWQKLEEILEWGAAFENADLPLQALATAAEKSEFRVVRWMENARDTAAATSETQNSEEAALVTKN
jgi:glycosidase